jgi:dephospho-CoA kinase
MLRNPELNQEQIEARMKAQWPQDVKTGKADYVIWNHGTKENLLPQIMEAYNKLTTATT